MQLRVPSLPLNPGGGQGHAAETSNMFRERVSVTKREILKLELNFCVHFRCFTTLDGSFALAICQGPHVADSPTPDPVRGIKVQDWVCSITPVRLALE